MFKKYNSIENTYREEYLSRIRGHDLWYKTYIVQEKAHGSNLSFWTTDGVDFTTAKRSESLKKDDKFYNHQLLLERHLKQFQSIWTALKSIHQDLNQLTIYGEVIGGNYPHQEVPKAKNAMKVQKGIFYCPGNEFFAFDILINAEKYLDVNEANELFEANGLFYAKTLHEGNIESCLAYPNEFDSTIPAQLGLPALSPNICEGVVIRPKVAARFNNGQRVILKNKNSKWSEKIMREKKIRISEPLSEPTKEMIVAIQDYMTENRLNNVISKFGEPEKKDFGKLLGLLNKDAFEDFIKDHKESYELLEKKEQKAVTKSMAKPGSALINTYFDSVFMNA